MRSASTYRALASFALALAVAGGAHAQATRTWVSGVGDDANPCSRTAPCKTFAGAISKTATGGEINVIDPGGFGGVTITKSITISAEGPTAGVLVSGTNAIIVNAPSNAVITLRGLDIEGLGTGLNGIRFLAGATLHVEKCLIHDFTQFGIDFEPTNASQLFVIDSVIFNNVSPSGGGILVKPGVGGSTIGSLDRVRLERNNFGLSIQGLVNMAARDSAATANTTHGFLATSTAGAGGLMLDNSSALANGMAGARSDGGGVAGTTVRIANSTFFGNATGLQTAASGTIISSGGNHNDGNGTNGAPTSTVLPQ
ncbi:MAG TPA: right-handed parallel beta-helix repeat-containing protein [Thermoanaerobaculia bacterium]|nr:right-handed parallel beta-helix repeat-containing protein [Thermoanaerobaculia bacterium]